MEKSINKNQWQDYVTMSCKPAPNPSSAIYAPRWGIIRVRPHFTEVPWWGSVASPYSAEDALLRPLFLISIFAVRLASWWACWEFFFTVAHYVKGKPSITKINKSVAPTHCHHKLDLEVDVGRALSHKKAVWSTLLHPTPLKHMWQSLPAQKYRDVTL